MSLSEKKNRLVWVVFIRWASHAGWPVISYETLFRLYMGNELAR